jgi:Ni,Fe-hydrogenase III small subunit
MVVKLRFLHRSHLFLIYTGAMTRSMRIPALRAYHAAPDPKICVAYGACGCAGGIFHDLYCVWGGADKIIPIDVYIPGCPPTPPATVYGFAMALGILEQKLKATYSIQAEDEKVMPRHPEIPLNLRVDIEREARRMAGYWHGKRIAEVFLNLISPNQVQQNAQGIQTYLDAEGDPRLTEIVQRLSDIYHAKYEDA